MHLYYVPDYVSTKCWYSVLTMYLLVLGSPGSRGRAGEVTGAGHGVWVEAPDGATATLITCTRGHNAAHKQGSD